MPNSERPHMNDIEQAIIDLHNIARLVENKIGFGQLSDDIRRCADRLNTVKKQFGVKNDYT
jgi:hypothetical protein